MDMQQSNSAEEQFAVAIEAGEWYDSDSDTENQDTDSGESSSAQNNWADSFSGDGMYSTPSDLLCIPSSQDILNQLYEIDGIDGDTVSEGKWTDGNIEDGNENGEEWKGEESTVMSLSSFVVPEERPKYYSIAYEIMTTERTYVQSLRLLEKVVHGAVKTSQLTKRPILPEQGRKEIFLNIGEIYALHFDLLQELEDRMKHWDTSPLIADVMAKRAPFFKLYSMYSARFDSAQVAYCKWLKASKPFADLIKLIETGKLCRGLPVSSYMLCPVQRIPRYKLLLEDYLRHLPDCHPDIENTKAALAAISEAAQHMNERISDLENQAKVVQMQKTFVGKENLVAPGRKYIGRGPVYFVPSNKWKQRVLFLFSDILLIARVTAAGRYRIQHKVQLKKMMVSVVQSPILHNAFCIAERGLAKPFRLCAKSSEERTKWISELTKAKANDEGLLTTMGRNSPYAAVLNDPEAHSSILAVLNDPSFEHSQPSWIRTTLRHTPSPARKGLPFASYALAAEQQSREANSVKSGDVNSEDVESGGMESGGVEEVDFGEGLVTEFIAGEEERRDMKVLKYGLDNSLSSYMCYQCDGREEIVCWFVLTSRTLVCYQDHTYDVASSAFSLTSCTLSTSLQKQDDKERYSFRLKHGNVDHVFKLRTRYDYKRWTGTLHELLQIAH